MSQIHHEDAELGCATTTGDAHPLPVKLASGTGATSEPLGAISADQDAAVAASEGLRLMGFAARETAAATASFRIVEGATGAAGDTLAPVALAANGVASQWYGPDGIAAPGGLSVEMLSGDVDLTLFYRS